MKKLRSRKIICLNDMKEFESVKKAAEYYEVLNTSIINVCRGLSNTVKVKGDKYIFMYYDEYILLSEEDIHNKKGLNTYKATRYIQQKKVKIICINDGQIFDSITEASISYGISPKSISKVCNDHIKTTRTINGTRLIFMRYDKYIGKSKPEIEELVEERVNRSYAPVRCINTNEVFKSMTEAAKQCNVLNYSSIGQVCSGNQYITRTKDGKKLKWEYYNKK